MPSKKKLPTREEVDALYSAAEEIWYTTRDASLKLRAQHAMHEIALRLFNYYHRMVIMERLIEGAGKGTKS